jgi:ribosome-binding protein aMBF1 (putative translation factor)
MLERTKAHPTKKNYIEVTLQVPGCKDSHYKIPNTDDIAGKVCAFLHELEQAEKTSWEVSVSWEELAEERIARYGKAGIALRGARYREGLSQKDLARLCNISQENLSRMENGKRAIGEKTAKKLAQVLKVDYKLLLSEEM